MKQLPLRLRALRKSANLTQMEVAERLNVSFQAVSLWERGETLPDIAKLPELADLYHTTLDYLLRGKEQPKPNFEYPAADTLFDVQRMSTYITTYAGVKGMHQTVKALHFARQAHTGQTRKGNNVPYIYHPLNVACHALALGIDDDSLVAACLLHDVCEDCGVLSKDLPVETETREIVALLTKTGREKKDPAAERQYFEAIYQNPKAMLVKLLDRAQNVSGMAGGFQKEKLISYINETERIFYPMIQAGKTDYPQYKNALFLIKYQLASTCNSLKQLLSEEN